MNRSVASYTMPNRVMILDSMLAFSPKFQGLAVLHESTHAFLFELNPRRPNNPDPDYMPNQERDVRERMKPVIIKLGGPMYQNLLENQITYIVNIIKNFPISDNFSIIPRTPPYNIVMDQIFGPAQSVRERNLRAVELYIQAWFEYLDRYYLKLDKPQIKTKVLLTIAPLK